MHRFSLSPLARFSLAALVAACLLPALGGCSSSSPSAAGGKAAAPVRVAGLDPVQLRQMGFQVRWISTVQPLRAGGITGAEVFGDAVAMVEGPDNLLTVLGWGDGRQRFKKRVGLPSEQLFGPYHRGGVVLLNSGNRVFEVDALSGDLLSVNTLDRTVSTAGALRDTLVIFGGANGRLFAHSLVTGRKDWEYQMSGDIVAAPLLANGNVFVTDRVGTYGLFNGLDGRSLWRNRTFGPVTAGATTYANTLLVPSEDRTLYALDVGSGLDRWVFRADFPLKAPAMVVGDTIYLPAPNAETIAIDDNGQQRWRKQLGARPLLATERGVYAQTPDGLILFDPADGRVLAETKTGAIVRATTAGEGSLLLSFADGRVVRLDPAP